MKYKVTIIGHIDIEADSEEDAQQQAMKQFKLENEITSDKFGQFYSNILEFHAFQTLTPEEVFNEKEIIDEDQKYYENEAKAIKEGEEYIKNQQEIKMNNLLSDI